MAGNNRDKESNKIISIESINRNRTDFDEEDFEDDEQERSGEKPDIRKILAFSFIIAIFVFLGSFLYIKFHKYTKYTLVAEKAISAGSFVGYKSFDSNVLKYSKDGALYMASSGKELWVESYEMKDPVVAVSKSYAAVGDRKGTKILTFTKDGKVGEIKTLLPLTKIVISDFGVVAAVLEDNNASYISFYDYDGKTLDISVKSKLSGDGYPTDISLSPNGKQLMVSYQYLDSGDLKGRVVFYDFSEIGKSVANRFVGGFDEDFAQSLIARVRHIDSTYSFAAADTGIYFFSSKNLLSPELVKKYTTDKENAEEIYSIDYNDKYVGVVYKIIDGEIPYRFDIYRPNGSLLLSKEFEFDYSYFKLGNEEIYFYQKDGDLKIYNMSGVLKFDARINTDLQLIVKNFWNKYTILTQSSIKEIKLK